MNKFLVGLLVVVGGGLAGWYFMNGGTFAKVMPKNIDTSMTAQTTPSVASSEQTTISDSGSTMGGGTKGGVVSQSTINYTESGFSPAAITVKKGTSVSFENQSTVGMWVASDVHPTHQLLPGFDAKKSFIKGEVYTYTFAKVGTWTFHNHASPTHLGKVVVTE
ncbi:hypothetical protein KBC80_03625 [Candidatus Woesebacteria bacterium]|jgi:plastocyanin|nr:hypothetical protein [Candidatus Woesebacteria bacterium]